ncbi:MAG: hypothetical protein ACYC96_11200 [Fimbriimonadaceae bacterium]
MAAAIAVVLAGLFFFAGRNSPSATAEQFMDALGRGDAKELTDVSYARNGDKAALLKAFEFATQDAGKNYSFLWRIKDSRQADARTASVQLAVIRNARSSSSFEENFEIPLVRQGGRWLVDVAGINDLMYPALPR